MHVSSGARSISGCRIRIDKDGMWYYNDLPIINKTIYLFFNQHLEPASDGGYQLRIRDETCPVIVEDTPFVVVDVWLEQNAKDGRDAFFIRLNDETTEVLNLSTLTIRHDNVPCCRVKEGKFPARFSRPAYYRLAEHVVEHEDGRFSIPLNATHYYL
ncbi:MAG: DUF1285 domain-containing protein [Desulfobacterota bacterium]|nr:DUF1285 domain-containing protein [Thermodesulfobacteriota bacterium]